MNFFLNDSASSVRTRFINCNSDTKDKFTMIAKDFTRSLIFTIGGGLDSRIVPNLPIANLTYLCILITRGRYLIYTTTTNKNPLVVLFIMNYLKVFIRNYKC